MGTRLTSFLLTTLALASTLGVGTAHAAPSVALKAPFDCGTDDLAQRSGILIGYVTIPRLPTQTHCHDVDPLHAPAVWSYYTAPSTGAIRVTSSASGGTVCVFVGDSTCSSSKMVSVSAGVTYAIGASLTDQTSAVLNEIDVTFYT